MPLGDWFRDGDALGRYLDILSEPAFTQRGYFSAVRVEKLVDDHRQRRADNSDLLWELINFELWQRIYIDRTLTMA